MEYRRLGRSGLKVSALSFGSWVTFSAQMGEGSAKECMKVAYDAGVNFFDNAEVYAKGESEILMGKALKSLGWSRDTYSVSSKVFWGGEKPTQNGLCHKHIIEACHAALKRLQVEYLDLYFCHRPDPETPIEETVRAMHTLVQQGKIFYWGTSEWSVGEIDEAYQIASREGLTPPSMEQPQYNLFHRERLETEYAPLFSRYGMGTTIWSPLASGILTNKYADGIPAGSRLTVKGYEFLRERFETEWAARVTQTKRLADYAKELEMTCAQLAIAWCLKKAHVSTVILGATRVEQLKETLVAIDLLMRLTPEVVSNIEGITA